MRSTICLSTALFAVLFGCSPSGDSDAVVTGSGLALDSSTAFVELIQNGDFDTQSDWRGWLHRVLEHGRHGEVRYHAQFSDSGGYIAQRISIPNDAISADLTFSLTDFAGHGYFKVWVPSPGSEPDIIVNDIDDHIDLYFPPSLEYLASYFSEHAGGPDPSDLLFINRGPVSLLSYKGQTITLMLLTDADGVCRLDDVSVKVGYSDFSLSTATASQSIALGSSTTYPITTEALGVSERLKLSVSGVPAGAMAALSRVHLMSGVSSILTVDAGSAAPGTYTLTVTGVGEIYGTHQATLTLNIFIPDFVNGGFEAGSLTGWTPIGSVNAGVSDSHSGSYNARIGKPDAPTGVHTLSQSVAVLPTGTTTLSFWAYFQAVALQAGDLQRARIRSASGQVLDNIFKKLGNNSQIWQQFSVDLTPYAGTIVVLEFEVEATQVGAFVTHMRVDDVHIIHN